MNVLGYATKKLLSTCVALFLIATLTFLMMKVIPGDPFQEEQALPPEIHQALRVHYGLEDPLWEQYQRYLLALASWDFGPSFKYKDRSINSIITETFPVSAMLGVEAFLFSVSVGLGLGMLSALYAHRRVDAVTMLFTTIGLSLPNFAIAVFLQHTMAMQWELLPVARWGTFLHTVLPMLALAAAPTAFIARLARGKMIEVLDQPYIKTARAKGLSEWAVMRRHVLRNALLPLTGYFGQLFAGILTGSFVIEKIFAIPGLGQWFVKGVMNRDYTMIMALTFFYSVILLAAIFVSDLLCRWLDPRLRQGEREC
jgi:oligopeptide transport system permease protein